MQVNDVHSGLNATQVRRIVRPTTLDEVMEVVAAHPRFIEFLEERVRFDPEERFQSDWRRHYRATFAASCA